MNQSTLSSILRQLDLEVDRLLQARHLLTETLPGASSPPAFRPQPEIPSSAMRTLRKAQWEMDETKPQDAINTTVKSMLKTVKLAVVPSSAQLASPPRAYNVSPAGRKKMAAAQRRRWKKFHQAKQEAQDQVARQAKVLRPGKKSA
jgi:hypothetical protein